MDPLVEYLKLFFHGWKNGYKIAWIFHQIEEKHGTEFLQELERRAGEEQYPLYIFEGDMRGFRCPVIVAVLSRKISDWMFDHRPDETRFIECVMRHRERLQCTGQKLRASSNQMHRALAVRRGEALDNLGGQVKHVGMQNLRYISNGRKTGENAPLGFGCKEPRLRMRTK